MSESATPATAVKRKLPSAVIALGITSLFTDIGSEMIFPLLPVFLTSLGAAPAFLGFVEGLADAIASLLKLVFGYVSDHAPRRKPFVLFGYATATLVRPLVAMATAPWHVLTVRVTDRIGKGIRSAPRDALIAGSVSAKDAGRAFGFHRAMDHAGAVIGPLVATTLLGLGWSLRNVFWVAIIPGILALVAVATVREPEPFVEVPANVSAPPVAPGQLPAVLRHYLTILFLFSLGNSSDAFLLLRARDLGMSLMTLPMLWSAFHLAKVLSSYLGGDLSDRVPRAKLIVCGWLVYAGTYLAFGFATKEWHVWLLFILYGTYYGLTEPAEKALVRDLAPLPMRGRAYGLYSFVIGITAVPAGVLTGWLWQTFSPRVALTTGAALAALAALTLLLWEAARAKQAHA